MNEVWKRLTSMQIIKMDTTIFSESHTQPTNGYMNLHPNKNPKRLLFHANTSYFPMNPCFFGDD
jgi:hypothetical protein